MFYKKYYPKIYTFITKKKSRLIIFKLIYKGLPAVVFLSYFILLSTLLVQRDSRTLECITVPLGVFVTVTMIRGFVNRPRPYETLAIVSVFDKDTKGKSFPSRHSACAAVIAMTALYVEPIFGIILMAVSILIALSRVLGGVHYPIDAAAGFLYAVIMSVICFYVII